MFLLQIFQNILPILKIHATVYPQISDFCEKFFVEILVQLILKALKTMYILVYCICVCSPNISFYKDLSLFTLSCHFCALSDFQKYHLTKQIFRILLI